ncbi:uncharacterized protein ACRADG_012981 [Cochliomyia hominivorax]
MFKILFCSCVLLFTINKISANTVSYNASQFKSPTAHQIMRLSKSAEMRNYMKPEVETCKDFYQYACGNWAKINPAIDEPKTGIFSVLSKAYDRKLYRILDGAKTSGDIETDRKVKYFYESCLKRRELKHDYRENLLNIMEEFGGMPALKGAAWKEDEFDWLETIALILRKYGRKIILGVDINADLTNNENNRLYLGQLDDLVTGKAKEYYERLSTLWQLEMQSELGLSPPQVLIVAKEIADFTHKLAKGMIDPMEGLGMEDKTRLRLLDEMTENYGPAINFTQFVKSWLGYEYRLPVYEYVENYIRNLRILMLETPPNVVANYIMWELIQDFRLKSQKTTEKQKEMCVEVTKKHFIKYLDHIIYKQLKAQQPEIIDEVQSMWKQLKLSFEDILHSSSSSWMLESTRDKAVEKLHAMSLEINGYEGVDFHREFSALTISSGNFYENLLNVLQLKGLNFRMKLQESPKLEDYELLSFTPAYAAEYNRVILPVAFLQPRYLWDDVYPKALKYGTVGYIMAHEMAHGFDDTIRKYDAKGNLNNWWDRNASAVFATRKECLRQQYGQHKFGGKYLPKTQAQGENIADNVGIRIAYAAYEMWLSKHHNTPEHLPHMDKISARQLFFISAAQIWCTDINRIWHHIVAATDVHPPEEVRVRAMLANFEAFAEAFECQLGSPMHPHRKCIIHAMHLKSIIIFIIYGYLSVKCAEIFTTEREREIVKYAKTADIKAYMNSNIDPCKDYYEYACNNWYVSNPAQITGKINTDPFMKITKGFDRKLSKLLAEEKRQDGGVEDKMKDFYASCLNTKEEKENYRTSLIKLYKEVGEFSTFKTEEDLENPTFKWWSKIAEIQYRYGKSIILSLYILDDIKNKSRTMPYIGPPEFELIQGSIDIDIDKIQQRRIRKYMISYFNIDPEDANVMAQNAVIFENNLTSGGTDVRLGKNIQELLTLYNTTDLIDKYEDLFDVREYLEIVLGTKDLPKQVYVYDESYLDNLYDIFNSTDPELVEDYILWLLLEEFLIDINSKSMKSECMDKTKKYFGKYVDHAIYNKYRSQQSEADIYELWHEIKATFRHNLEQGKYKWITNATRTEAIKKLNNMNLTINSYDHENFTQIFQNLQINSSNYVLNVQNILKHTESLRENKLEKKTEEDTQVLSFTPIYNIMENQIKIPVALLQPYRIWHPIYPKAIQYGTLGFLIAHEMIHGFDDEGRKYDAKGSAHDWWDEQSEKEFEKGRQCFEDQYHAYVYDGKRLVKSALQAENIADNGGINIAYDAYKRWLSKQKRTEDNVEAKDTLPRLDLNNRQLFFLSFAQIWCEDIHSLFRSTFIAGDVHAPAKFRVIGSLSNSKEFSWIYKCANTTKMNPKRKCEIY